MSHIGFADECWWQCLVVSWANEQDEVLSRLIDEALPYLEVWPT